MRGLRRSEKGLEWRPVARSAHNPGHRDPFLQGRAPCFSSDGHRGAAKCWCEIAAPRESGPGTCPQVGLEGRGGGFQSRGVCLILIPLGGKAEDGRTKIPGASPDNTEGGEHAPGNWCGSLGTCTCLPGSLVPNRQSPGQDPLLRLPLSRRPLTLHHRWSDSWLPLAL